MDAIEETLGIMTNPQFDKSIKNNFMRRINTLILLLVAGHGFAQIRMEGVVKDSIGSPLELANVIAINQETKALESYGITNDRGYYRLALSKNAIYSVQVSYIGKKTATETITTKEEDIKKDFSLESDTSLN